MPKPSTLAPAASPALAAAEIAVQIRRALKDGGSPEHAAGVQWFFKDEIKSHGWYTADLRRATVRFRKQLKKERGLDFLVEVGNRLFNGPVLEEKIAAVFLLEKLDSEFGDKHFKLFESWLDRISSWADRCARALPDLPHGRRQARAHEDSDPLGKVAEPVAPPRRVCSPDSRREGKDVLSGNHPAFQLASYRPR